MTTSRRNGRRNIRSLSFVDGEVREYEVFAAAESRVLYEDEEGFRYYRSGGIFQRRNTGS